MKKGKKIKKYDLSYEDINKDVEIFEEPNKIEKCKHYEDFLEIDDYIEHLKNKINELIYEINKSK